MRRNRDITAKEVRLISDDGEQIGVVSLLEALRIGESEGLDVIEIAPNAKPPVCKLIDYGKFQYQQKKKQQEAKKKQTVMQVKEVKFRTITDDHDFQFKVKHAERFLAEGDRVKVVIRFRGREIVHKDAGLLMCEKVKSALTDHSVVEQEAKMEGRQMVMVLVPKKS